MDHVPRFRGSCAFPIILLLVPATGMAADSRIDHRFAAPHGPVLLAVPTPGCQVLVTADGRLQFADGAALSVAPTGALAFTAKQRPSQRLLDGHLPILTTTRQSEKLAMEWTAFVAPRPPMACLRVALRNRTAAAARCVLRIRADNAHGTLGGKHPGFRRDGQVFALCELREGSGQAIGAVKPKRSVFRREGGRLLPNWAPRPRGPCDRGFRDIVAGFSEPATYHLKVEPRKRYIVAVGLCESHWKAPGNRICDILIEGRKVATIDPIKKPYGRNVPFVLTFPARDRDRNGWISVTSVANPASPDVNSILNVVWLFEESVGKGLPAAEIVSGRANAKAHCYVNCGGGVEAPGPSTLDYRVDLLPNGSATLWLKKPFAVVKTADAARLAALDPAKLRSAAEQAWRAALGRATSVKMADPAPADILSASIANLLSLRTPQEGRVALCAGPFGATYSPAAAAFGAAALDRMGLHAEADEVLADLAARQTDDRLWHAGTDRWCATGQVLWALVSHYEVTGDKEWLAANYRTLRSAAEALVEARELTKWIAHDPGLYFHGLMPVAPYRNLRADYWFVHDFWAYQGVRFAARAARALQKPNDYEWLEDNLADHAACLRRSLAKSRVVGPAAGCLPAVPSEAQLWTFAGCVAALYPTQVLSADDEKLIAATFRYLDKHRVEHLPGGTDGRGAAIDVPLACRYALSRLARGEAEETLAAFTTIANIAAPTGTLPEGANLRTRAAAGALPSAASAGGYVLLLRDMLAREAGNELHLCPCVPEGWLAKPLAVSNAPTRFGPVSFTATLASDGRKLVVEASIPARLRGRSRYAVAEPRLPPEAVVVHLPVGTLRAKAARSTAGQVKVNGRTVRVAGWKGRGRLEIELVKTKADQPR